MDLTSDTQGNIIIVLFSLVLLALIMLYLSYIHFIWMPESLLIIAFGLIIGALMTLADNVEAVQKFLIFVNTSILKTALIPPIIYYASLTLNQRYFFQNFWSILTYATVGTIISTVVFCGIAYGCKKADLIPEIETMRLLMFGALISAVDPVATLATMEAVDAPRLLSSIVFGESVINDGVTIAIFESLAKVEEKGSDFSGSTLGIIVAQFLLILTLSTLIGIAFGVASSLLLAIPVKKGSSTMVEFVLFIFGIISYFVAEECKLSGIVALLAAGVIQGHYALHSVSYEVKTALVYSIGVIANTAEAFTFLLIGISLPLIPQRFEWSFIALSVFLCILGRALNVFPLSFLLNLKRHVKFVGKYQVCSFMFGLRGAIAMSLSLSMPSDSQYELSIFATTTIVIVIFTIVVFGGSAYPLLRFFGYVNREPVNELSEEGRLLTTWTDVDNHHLKTFLIRRKREQKMEEIA